VVVAEPVHAPAGSPASEGTEGAISVLLIAGAGRSGSTLLELMLDQIPGLTAVGELTDIWDAGLGRNELCGCGQPFAECPFWTEVGARAFGGWSNIDLRALAETHEGVARNRRLPRQLAGPLAPKFRARLDGYARTISRILAAIAAISGARMLVDASKWPSYAMVLRRAPGVELQMIQLVRDPRGVAHSWGRELERPHALGEPGEGWAEMRRDHAVKAASHWTALNLGIELVAALGVQRQLVRYEDLVTTPRETLSRILTAADAPASAGALDFIEGETVRLAPGHGIAGNPSRFRHGDVVLRESEEWREMPRASRLAVGAIAGPLELVYRHRARRSGGPRSGRGAR
jgi:hypothetical protein